MHDLQLSVETLRHWMIEEASGSPVLVESRCTLLVFIDDATSALMELRLHEISDVEAANAIAPEFIADYNRRFARVVRSEVRATQRRRYDLGDDQSCQILVDLAFPYQH